MCRGSNGRGTSDKLVYEYIHKAHRRQVPRRQWRCRRSGRYPVDVRGREAEAVQLSSVRADGQSLLCWTHAHGVDLLARSRTLLVAVWVCWDLRTHRQACEDCETESTVTGGDEHSPGSPCFFCNRPPYSFQRDRRCRDPRSMQSPWSGTEWL